MKTKEVVPYAILKTQDKNEYYLLASGASEPEDWMHEQQQKFLVVPSYGVWQKHYIITTNPEIRVFANPVTERVQIMEVDEDEKVI